MACSTLENAVRKGFWPIFRRTLHDFAAGAKMLARIDNEKNPKLAPYQYSMPLAVPLALLAGTSVIGEQQAFKKARAG